MKIPPRKSKPLTYPFDQVKVNQPYEISIAGEGNELRKKVASAATSARQYAKRAGKKFVIRSSENGITIYRTK